MNVQQESKDTWMEEFIFGLWVVSTIWIVWLLAAIIEKEPEDPLMLD